MRKVNWKVWTFRERERTMQKTRANIHTGIQSRSGATGTILKETCVGYVRRVTHDEIADAVG